MLNIVLNESELIKNALEGKYDEKKIIVILQLLLKYYYIEGMNDRLKLREQLLNFLKNNYKGYKRAKWEDVVTKIVTRFLKTIRENKLNVRLIDINEVAITKGELEKIKLLDNPKLEKIAFVMLVYAKLSNKIIDNNEGWINKSCSIILKEAKVNLKGIEKEKIFNELYVKGYIEQRKRNDKTNMRICYIDEETETIIIINDFDAVVYQYLIWNGEKWKKCEECGKWIQIKSNKPPKYCRNCKKTKQLEWQRESMRKSRNEDCEVLLE